MYPYRFRPRPRKKKAREEERGEEKPREEPSEEKPKFLWRRIKVTNKLERLYNYHQPPIKPLLVKVPALKCPRCGYYWIPRKQLPKICPSCNSRLLEEYEVGEDIPIEVKVEREGVDKEKLGEIRKIVDNALSRLEFLREKYKENSDLLLFISSLGLTLRKIEEKLEEL